MLSDTLAGNELALSQAGTTDGHSIDRLVRGDFPCPAGGVIRALDNLRRGGGVGMVDPGSLWFPLGPLSYFAAEALAQISV